MRLQNQGQYMQLEACLLRQDYSLHRARSIMPSLEVTSSKQKKDQTIEFPTPSAAEMGQSLAI